MNSSAPLNPGTPFISFRSEPIEGGRLRALLDLSRHPPAAGAPACRAVPVEDLAEIRAVLSGAGKRDRGVDGAPLLIAFCLESETDLSVASAWMTAGRVAIEAGRAGLASVAIAPPGEGISEVSVLKGAGRVVALLALGRPYPVPPRPATARPDPAAAAERDVPTAAGSEEDDRQFLASFLEIASASAMADDLDTVLVKITEALGRLFPVDGATLAIREEGGIILREVMELGGEPPREGESLPEDDSHLMGRVILRDRPMWRNDTTSELRFEDVPGRVRLRSDMTIPLHARGRVMGAFRVGSCRRHAYDPEDFDVLQRCADLTAVAVETQRLLQATRRLSEQDGLTGVSNHRHFLTLLQQEVARSRRTDRSLALLMIDIDDFKRINDTHGHQAGDQVLRHVAQLVSKMLRRSDTVARYGGEEFAVLLPEATFEQAMKVGEALRAEVEGAPITMSEPGLPLRARVSIGVAVLPGDAFGPGDLVGAADRGLYQAKRSGKNRICHAP